MGEITNSTRHLPTIDGLRALAAIWVMVGHFAIWENAGKSLLLFHDFTCSNHLAVTFFIVISGFCLALPVLRAPVSEIRVDTLRFFKGRARRILPTYYAALILAIALDYAMHALGTKTAFKHNVITHIFLIHDVVGYEYGISGPFWSVALEWHIYFLFPLIIMAWKKYGAARTCIVTLIGSYCIVPVWTILVQTIYFFGFDHAILVSPNDCSYYLGLFTIGVFAADIYVGQSDWAKKARMFRYWGNATAALMTALAVKIVVRGLNSGTSDLDSADLLTALASACLLVYVTLRPTSRTAAVLSLRPLVWIGGFSYSLYATHYNLGLFGMDFIRHHLAPRLHLLASVTILPIGAIAFAFVFAALFETPFRRKSPPLNNLQEDGISTAPEPKLMESR